MMINVNKQLARIVLQVVAVWLGTVSAALAQSPENGWWWTQGEPGRGYNIEVQGGLVFVATFIYEDDGTPIWYSGGGRMADNRWDGELFRFRDGQCLTCDFVAPTQDGSLPFTITFTDSDQATVSLGGVQFDITRFPFGFDGSLNDFLGLWSIVSAPGFLTTGEFLLFTERTTLNDGTPALSGVRFGRDNLALLATVEDVIIVVLDSSTSFFEYWIVSREGYNRLYGEYWLERKEEPPPTPGTGRESLWHRTFQLNEFARNARTGADEGDRDTLNELLYRNQTISSRDGKDAPAVSARLDSMVNYLTD